MYTSREVKECEIAPRYSIVFVENFVRIYRVDKIMRISYCDVIIILYFCSKKIAEQALISYGL